MSFNGNQYGNFATKVITTRGDIIRGSSTGARERLGLGSSTEVLTSDGTDIDWAAAGGAPTTTKGDLSGYSTTAARIPISTNNFSLYGDSTAALGLKWAASPTSTLTTTGDLLASSATNVLTRIAGGASGEILTGNGAGVLPTFQAAASGGNTYARVVKKADETITSDNTLTDDSELVIALSSNKTYGFTLIFFFKTEAVTDIKITFTAPTGADGDFNTVRNIVEGYPINNEQFTSTVAFDGTGGNSWAFVFGKVGVSTTAGNLALQWAQNTSDGTNTIVNSGSTLVVWEETA